MHSSRTNGFCAWLAAAVAASFILTGCDSSPTEPKAVATSTPTPTASPTPIPPAGSVSGTWTGTYDAVSYLCNTSAEARFQQTGSAVTGVLTATGSCGSVFDLAGTLQGATFEGSITDNEIFVGSAHGTLSDSTLEITIDNGSGFVIAHVHLHR